MRIRTSVSLMAMGVAIATAAPAAAQTTTGTLQPPSGSGQAAANAQTPADDFATANDIRSSVVAGEQTATTGGDIVVTGTRIVRPNNRSAAPIVTTTAAEIQAQGATTIEEVLNRLPQVQANSEQNLGDLSEGRQRIKLRALGYERTLSLIDGLRFGLANTIDVGIIPTALIERVDVLSGGASSVYGADAVSGVINFVMKKNFEGIRLDGAYSFFNHDNRDSLVTETARRFNFGAPTGMANDGGRVNVTLSAGTSLFDNRVNLSSFINYRQSDAILFGDRSHSSCSLQQLAPNAPFSCFLASWTAAGTIIPQSGPRAGQFLVNNPNGNRTFVGLNSGPGTSANPFDEIPFQRDFKRVNFGGFLTAEISEEIEFYASGLFYRDNSQNGFLNRTTNFSGFSPAVPYQVNCNNPFLSAAQATDLCGANAGSATAFAPIDLRYRFDGLPSIQLRYTNESYRAVAGFRGRGFGGAWTYDIATMFTRGEITNRGATTPSFQNTNRSLNVVNVNGVPTCQSVVDRTDPTCVPFNAFIPYNNDAAVNDYIFPDPLGATTIRIPRLFQFLGTISGDLGNYGITSPFAEEGVAVAVGVEYRDELERRTANAIFRQLSGGEDLRLTQSILEANVEVQIPLVENQPWTEHLEVSGGYRISDYNRLDGSFDTWKVEGVWSPIADITFRGGYNKSQRAPDVAGAAAAADVFFEQGFYNDPCAPQVGPGGPNGPRVAPRLTLEQCRNTGLPDALYNSPTLICPDERCTVRQGGFGLTPESAFTTTFGVILRPRFLPGLTVSVDRWFIKVQDSLDFIQPQFALDECGRTGLEYFCRAIVRNPGSGTLISPSFENPATGWVVRGPANGFKSANSGIDIQSQYNLGLGSYGRLDLGFNGSITTNIRNQPSPVAPVRECAGYFGRSCGESLPKWQHTARATWISPDRTTSVSLNWRHRGAHPLDLYAPADRGIPTPTAQDFRTFTGIGAYDWFDLALTFDVTPQMTFRLAANNIFDRDPPIVPNSRQIIELSYSNTIFGYDMLGRNIVAGVTLNF